MKELTEIWKPIPKYEKYYQVSNLGRVKSLERDAIYRRDSNRTYYKKERIINQHVDRKGYLKVKLYNGAAKGETIGVHRLVAKAFIQNIHNLSQVNHINGVKSDNFVENLEWVTHRYNVQHAYNTGLKKPENYKGSGNKTSKLVEQQVIGIRNEYETGNTSITKLSKKYNTCVSNVSSILKRNTWTHV